MFFKSNDHNCDTYAFFSQEEELNEIATIRIIGVEERDSTDYYWDNKKHEGTEMYIFQYTLSGSGICEVNNIKYEVSPGKAFFINYPSNARYYFPEGGEPWNFIFVTLVGKEVKKCWDYIYQAHGHVIDIPSESPLIQRLLSTINSTSEGKLDDPFLASQKAYSFVMECYSHFKKKKEIISITMPENILDALVYMNTQYHKPLTLDDIANKAKVSKYYFIKKFKEIMSISPLQYLTKYRIEKACYLLNQTDKTIKEISIEVGFADSNYFCKVFRGIVGTSPSSFRHNNAPTLTSIEDQPST